MSSNELLCARKTLSAELWRRCALIKKTLTVTLFMLATLAWAAAQQPAQQPGRTPNPNAQQPGAQAPEAAAPVTEGCLGGSDPHFTLTDKAGTTYKLNIPPTADTSKLGQHVGEPVAVAGNVTGGKAGDPSIDVQGIGRGTGTCPGSKGAQPPPPKQ